MIEEYYNVCAQASKSILQIERYMGENKSGDVNPRWN